MAVRGLFLELKRRDSLFVRIGVLAAFLLLLFFLFFHGLLDGLDEVGAFLVVGELGGEVIRIFAPGIIKRSYSLIRVVEDAPNDFHPRDFGGPGAGLLRRFGRLRNLGFALLRRFFVIILFTFLRGRVFDLRLLL